jgi:hypothetical protein
MVVCNACSFEVGGPAELLPTPANQASLTSHEGSSCKTTPPTSIRNEAISW